MTKILVQATLILAALVPVGCYRLTYKIDEGSAEAYRTEHWNNYFIFGLIPVNERYDLSALCPDRRPVEVRTLMKPANVLSTIFGADLTTASTIEVMCMKEASRKDTFSDIKSNFKLPF